MRNYLLFILIALTYQLGFANSDFDSLYLKETDFAHQIDSLKTKFGKNKIIPAEIELECLVALSYYPELVDAHVEFLWNDKISSTMKMMPTIKSFFFHKKLKYVVHMNKSAASTNLNINDLSFNAKVGWIGHELGHVLQCVEKSRLGVLMIGIRHSSKKFITKHERETDIITIQHGLGYALYEGMHFTFNRPNIHPKYLEGLKKNYLSLDEILLWITKTKKTK
jgi:hypothetical protein